MKEESYRSVPGTGPSSALESTRLFFRVSFLKLWCYRALTLVSDPHIHSACLCMERPLRPWRLMGLDITSIIRYEKSFVVRWAAFRGVNIQGARTLAGLSLLHDSIINVRSWKMRERGRIVP